MLPAWVVAMRQCRQAAAALAVVQARGPLEQSGVEIKDIGRIGFAARRPAQQKRDPAVGIGVAGEAVVDNQHVPALVHERFADRAGGIGRQVLLARRRIGVGRHDDGLSERAGCAQSLDDFGDIGLS